MRQKPTPENGRSSVPLDKIVMRNKAKTFAEKYGLVVLGKPVRISKQTQNAVKALKRASERAIEAGKDWARTCNQRFGA